MIVGGRTGYVSADRAKAHILDLRTKGVGYKSIAEACSVRSTTVQRIAAGRTKMVRVFTEQEILSVDVGARAEGATVAAGPTREKMAALLRLGFTKGEIGTALLKRPVYAFSVLRRDRVKLRTAAAVEKLMKKVESGDLVPRRWGDPADVKELIRRGVQIPLRQSAELRDHFLEELAELRRSREALKPQNRSIVNAESTIHLAHFKE